ncbi:MAG: hypothetical protein JSW28_03310, partial [Thermoplasmata archaeon]
MKKVSTMVIIGLFIFGIYLGYLRLESKNTAVADWEPEIEISTDSGMETQGGPRVAVDNGIVHAVWADYEDGDGDIYYRHSLDEGVTWQPEQDISADVGTENQGAMSIAVEGDKVHVVWQETLDPMDPNEDVDIYYRHFDGLSWQPKQEISIDVFGDERQERPEIAVEGDDVHVIWFENMGSGGNDVDVIYRHFNGILWQPSIEIGTDVVKNVHQEQPDIAVENGRVHAVWFDARDGGGDKDIYYRYFDGMSWQPEQEISVDVVGTPSQSVPRITAENGKVYVIWREGDGTVDVKYRHFNGLVWEPVQEIGVDISGNEHQMPGAIAVENGRVYVVYRHWVDPTNSDIYYRYFNGTDWQPVEVVSTGIEDQRNPDIAVKNGIVHVVWQEGIWSNEYDIYYRRFVPPAPDLKVTSGDIVFNPDSPVVNGTSVIINATIHNIGTLDANDIKVSFYNGDPALGGTLIGVNQTIPFLMAGENYIVNMIWLPPADGTYEIYVAVDYPPPGMIMETNETNNIASKALEMFALLPPTLHIKALGDDIILNWTQPCTSGLSHYILYRATSQIDFDFNTVWVNTSSDHEYGESGPIPLRTVWNDTNAAFPGNKTNYKEQYYYVIRSVNVLGEVSSTSRTVGKWTKTFPQGVSTFSLPLEPLENMTIDNCLTDMNAAYIKWMDQTTHNWMKHGEGGSNDTQMKVGEGYEVKFASQTNYTFCGMPGAMISYDDDTGFSGFDPYSEAKNLTVSVKPDGNVTLTWQKPASMGPGDWCEV